MCVRVREVVRVESVGALFSGYVHTKTIQLSASAEASLTPAPGLVYQVSNKLTVTLMLLCCTAVVV